MKKTKKERLESELRELKIKWFDENRVKNKVYMRYKRVEEPPIEWYERYERHRANCNQIMSEIKLIESKLESLK